MIEEWDLTATNLSRVRARRYEVAVLPTGAVEPHNLHLPYGQDVRHTTWIARRACADAWERGAAVVCLPAIPYGVDCNLMDFPLTIHVGQQALDAVVRDIVGSLEAHGIRKVLILNGHGGNDFMPLIRRLQSERDVHLFLCDWWTAGRDRWDDIFDSPDDHAGEMETSVALALYPELVEPESAGEGAVPPFRFEALRRGWVRTSRRFARMNDHCAAGDPTRASAAKGREYLELVCARVSGFLVDLAASPLDERFPFEPA